MGKEYPPVDLGPWPNGINNRAQEFDLGEGELRDSVNFDITTSGRLRRRYGTDRVYAGASVRSVISTGRHLIFAEGTDLKIGVSSPTTLRSDLSPNKRISYTIVNGILYYSDGVVQGRVFGDSTHASHWCVERPVSAPVISAGSGGALYPGRYRVKVTFVWKFLEEGPASVESAVDIAAGEHISIDLLPMTTDPDVTEMRIYVAGPNDEIFFFNTEVPIATVSHNIFSIAPARGTLGTDQMRVFPPVDLVEYFSGRLWGCIGNVAWFSEPLRFGLIVPRFNFIMFPADITVWAGCKDGIYVAADKTYWLSGTDPHKFSRLTLGDFTGVKYSATHIRNTDYVTWFTPYGYAVGAPGGQLKIASENRIASGDYREGATLFREQRGIRQVIGNFRGAVEDSFKSSDIADMDIVRSAE